MRAISLVKKIEFEFSGNVARNALTLGDVDNDGKFEFVIGNDQGEVAIFKEQERLQTISNLSFVACIAVGDIRNINRNSLVIVTADGWCYIYEVPEDTKDIIGNIRDSLSNLKVGIDEVEGQNQSSSNTEVNSTNESVGSEKKNKKEIKNFLICVHKQRIPSNVKNIILGDIDNDGLVEMVVGLTDRVVRSYRWVSEPDKAETLEGKLLGKFVALYKWECANQIGSITLHSGIDGNPSILVAQPGGTFMRIKCQTDEEQKFENITNKADCSSRDNFSGSIDYQSLGISRMRNQNISTEIIGDLKVSNINQGSNTDMSKNTPYAIATLDGTIMLVQNEIILWAIAVDHQIFALTKLDITNNGSDDIVACSWDGQTYILDHEKNSVRFHLEEPVKAFHSGWYNVEDSEMPVTALVYVTFKNTVIIYYDIPLKDLICKRFEPDYHRLSELFVNSNRNKEQALEYVQNLDKKSRKDLIEYLLYNS
ncbi:KICSTOR complex protein ITFG2-like [Rhynchophorus ferrugineus]|uniref:KICSTOR complex protein ITFG2-like n=1 Tax=Rhynchophorus ferrugineus TaxID=354439 RepID=UPI003FCEABC9